MIGSDAIVTRGKPHPRTWGTYPRVLGHYARETGLFSQAEAVRKMTSMPAQKFGLWDRGLVRPDARIRGHLLVLDGPMSLGARASLERTSSDPDSVHVAFDPFPVDHALPMFEWGLTWVFAHRKHEHLLLHAAVVDAQLFGLGPLDQFFSLSRR